MFYIKISLFTFIVCGVVAEETTTYCTSNFCEKYPTSPDPACPTLPASCNESISLSGVFLPSPTACNCCKYCIGYLTKGDDCATGKKSSDIPTSICGPGLSCDESTEKCVAMSNTPCTEAQKEYDARKKDGSIGDYEIRPKCDGDGDFVPYHCTPGGICYCVDKNGNRIFGSSPNKGNGEFDLPCGCSRNHHEMSSVLGRDLRPGEYLRCAANGAYEPLQCLDDKTCICVDESDGNPSSESMLSVEIWAIDSSTLSCFNSSRNIKGAFYRRCEEIFINKTRDISERKDDNDEVLDYELPNCTPDGNYAPVQENHKYKFCSTPDGIPLLELEKTPETKTLRDEMNCKCTMATRLISSSEKPSCLVNGNYNTTQCRRGVCFIVDEDGNQRKLDL